MSTALYPSIYIKTFNKSLQETKQHVINLLTATYRVRAEHGDLETPIMAYTAVEPLKLGKFHKDWLDLAFILLLPIEMGVDGLIFWASYQEFADKSGHKCAEELEYIRKTLGPKVRRFLTQMKNCSIQMCEGRGRCIRKEYAEIKCVKNRGVSSSGTFNKTRPSGIDILQYFWDHYDCQCYKGWSGDDCTLS